LPPSLCAVFCIACTTFGRGQPSGGIAGLAAGARRLDRWRRIGLRSARRRHHRPEKTDEQRIAKQLYDTARLPQPFMAC